MTVPEYLKDHEVRVDVTVNPAGKRTSTAKATIAPEHHEPDGSVSKKTRDDYTTLTIWVATREFVKKFNGEPDPDHQTMILVHHGDIVMGGIADTESAVADPFA